MFRRVLAIWILMLYIPSAIGMNMNIHYCGGKIASVHFGYVSNEGCTCGTTSNLKKAKSSCCKDVHLTCELKSKQDASKSIDVAESTASLIFVLPSCLSFTQSYFSCATDASIASAYDPPDLHKLPLYKRLRVFRI